MDPKENECLNGLRFESEIPAINFQNSSDVFNLKNVSDLILGWDEETSIKNLSRQKTTNSAGKEKLYRHQAPITSILIRSKPKSRQSTGIVNRRHANYVNISEIHLKINENSSNYANNYMLKFKKRTNLQKLFTMAKRSNEIIKENLQKNIVINSVLQNKEKKAAKLSFLKSQSPFAIKKINELEASLRRTRDF